MVQQNWLTFFEGTIFLNSFRVNSVCPGARFSRNTLKWEFCWLSIIHHWGETCWWRYKTGIHFFQPGDVIFSESSCVPARPDQVDYFFPRSYTLLVIATKKAIHSSVLYTCTRQYTLLSRPSLLCWWHLNHRIAVVTSEMWYGNKVILKTLGSLPPQLWNFGNLNIWKLDARTPSWSLSRHLTSLLTTPWLAQIWEITKSQQDRCFDRSSFFCTLPCWTSPVRCRPPCF